MKTTITIITKALIRFACFALPVLSFAQDGSLDLSFDTDGVVTTPIGSSEDYGRAIAIQSDGKIVVAGYSDNGSQDVFAIVRYNTNGSLDNTFDTDGVVTTPIGTSGNRAHALAIQSDGKIVVAGYSYNGTDNDFAVARYNINGSLDNTFDTDGIVTTPIGTSSNDRAFTVAIQSDGKIVVAGYNTSITTNRDFALVRYNTNGGLDNTFNASGIVTTPIESGVDEGRSVVIQSDGKIVVAGFSFDYTTREFAIVRYNTNGSLDNTFDTDGIVTTAIGPSDDAAYSIAIQSDGKIVVAGYSHGVTYDFALVRYNIDGILDNTFDSGGIVTTAIGTSDDLALAVAIQSDGKILVAGHSLNGDNNFALVRYNTNGILDNTFDTDGIVTTDVGSLVSDDVVQSMALQSDGKILVAGYSSSSSNYYFAVARYTNSGTSGINLTANQNTAADFYPNPFSGQTTLQTAKQLNNATLKVYNSFGQQVNQLLNISGKSVTIYRDNLSSGLYFIQLIENNKTIHTEKLIITD